MKFKISGKVVNAEGGQGVSHVIVSAYDKDRFFDDMLGEAMTDFQGNFSLDYEQSKLASLFEGAPDVYFEVKTETGKVIHSTEEKVRFNVSPHEEFRIPIPEETLREAEITAPGGEITLSREKMTTLTCLEGLKLEDDLVRQIKADLDEKSSVLEMMKVYITDLEGELDNNALPFRKLRRLFELGTVPDQVEGHHYGVTLGIRTGDLRGLSADYGNLLGFMWGESVGKVCPWVGKSFTPMKKEEWEEVTAGEPPGDITAYRGINHFNTIEQSPLNVTAIAVLTFWLQLRKVPDAERLHYGNERDGGYFVSHKARSVYDKTPREVFRLNYRYTELGNNPPLSFLIDELVEIADGVYLGQLLFATERLWDEYNPAAEDEIWGYQHFGYFLLADEEWNVEMRRLFPHLEMPDAAITAEASPPELKGAEKPAKIPDKFTALTLAAPPDGDVDPAVLDGILKDLDDAGTVIRMLKSYSDELGEEMDIQSPVFTKLHTLFNAGIGPTSMDGFYHGALVSWQSQGLLAVFDVNVISVVWNAARFFSPWTGKRFDPIEKTRLAELTEGYEKGDVPTSCGANTVVYRTAKERFTRNVMKLAGVWSEEATEEEHRIYGYDAKTFFFIGKPEKSILAENKSKAIYQFNYRWKPLKNIPPDCFCVDEIVQIAEGMYLGLLIYATDILKPWDPSIDPSEYNYRIFGYFLLMDKEWHARRLRIGFDLDNT